MSKLKLNLNEEVGAVSDEPEFKKSDSVVLKDSAKEKKTSEVSFKQKSPAYWNITPGNEINTIVASSDKGDKFEGSIEDFNKILRG